VLAPFEEETEHFGRADQRAMINFRVRDLDAIRAQLQAGGPPYLTTFGRLRTDGFAGPRIPRAIALSCGNRRPTSRRLADHSRFTSDHPARFPLIAETMSGYCSALRYKNAVQMRPEGA
jgi:hypothetical protein